MAISEREYICKGCAKGELVDALKYIFDKKHPHTVLFTIRDGKVVIEVLIMGLEHEDGSGYRFNFKGWISTNSVIEKDLDLNLPGKTFWIRGYYDAQKQTGWFDPDTAL